MTKCKVPLSAVCCLLSLGALFAGCVSVLFREGEGEGERDNGEGELRWSILPCGWPSTSLALDPLWKSATKTQYQESAKERAA
jgi:hypothetical protein